MKQIKFLAILFMAIVTCASFSACSDDDEDGGNVSDIVGTWYATVGNGKASISLTFNNDKTGILDYEWDNINYHRVIYSFTYTFSGGKINCNGTSVDSDGSSDQESMTFEYSGGKITGGRWATDSPYKK